MISIIIIAVLVLVVGMAYLLFPQSLFKWNQWANRVIFKDDIFIRKNRVTGAGLIIAGLWLLWIYFHSLT
jgi:uncharacterized protein YjeT (DUF2065 family)